MKRDRFESLLRGTLQNDSLLGFYELHSQVPWTALIESAEKSIDIVIYFADNWIEKYKEFLITFLKQSGAHIRFLFADEHDPAILTEMKRLFPNYSYDQLKEKIIHTVTILQNAAKKQVIEQEKIISYRLPSLLNYSLQLFDDQIAVISFYQMYYIYPVESPAVVIDLRRSSHLFEFFIKERDGMIKKGRIIL